MLSYLVVSATQGSADAFVEAQITTGLQNVARQAFRIRRIEFQFPPIVAVDSSFSLCLARKTLAAIPTMTAHSVIRLHTRQVELTTSGLGIVDLQAEWTYSREEDLVIVEDPLYFQCDSATTSAANTFYCRIGYETRTITEVERLAIVAASLS